MAQPSEREHTLDRDDDVLDYLQNRMSPERRTTFENEMQEDTQLAAEVQVMQAARTELDDLGVPVGAAAAGWDRLSAAIDAPANTNRPPAVQYLQIAAAMVLAVAVWHFAVIPSFFKTGPATFQTASEEAGLADLTVVFNDTAPAGEIAALVFDLEGVVVSGPSALGTFKLRFADEERRDAALEALEAREDLIASVLVQ